MGERMNKTTPAASSAPPATKPMVEAVAQSLAASLLLRAVASRHTPSSGQTLVDDAFLLMAPSPVIAPKARPAIPTPPTTYASV